MGNEMQILNTPGYFYSVAYFISSLIMVIVSKRRFGLLVEFFKDMLYLLVLFGFMIFTDGMAKIFIVSMFVIILIQYTFLRTSIEAPRATVLFMQAKTFLYGELMASFAWQVYYFISVRSEKTHNLLHQIVIMAICYGVFAAIQLIFETTQKKGVEEFVVKRIYAIWAVVITVAVFSVSNMSFYSVGGLFSGTTAMDTYIIRTLVDSTGVIAITALSLMLHENQIKMEVYAMKNIMEMQYKNYQISKSSMEMVNRKYHDLKHQIALLREEFESEDKLEYLDQMEREISIYETRFQTGNKVLDALLATKATYCQKHNIEFKAIIEGELIDFMETMDVSALFGNILDNAIEGSMKFSDKSKRLINLQVTKDRSFLCVRTENYCYEKPRFMNGLPITSKSDSSIHGYGMKSIKYIVEKYGGSVIAEYKNGWFLLKILIPLSANSQM